MFGVTWLTSEGECWPKPVQSRSREDTRSIFLNLLSAKLKISPGYSTVQFLMATGQVYSGIVKKENSDQVVIQNADGDLLTLQKEDIDEMQAGLSGTCRTATVVKKTVARSCCISRHACRGEET